MKLPIIKHIAQTYSLEDLRAAENALLEGETLAIEVEGEDEGEQLTHILAAISIQEDIAQNGIAFTEALRNYTQRVRNSIN